MSSLPRYSVLLLALSALAAQVQGFQPATMSTSSRLHHMSPLTFTTRLNAVTPEKESSSTDHPDEGTTEKYGLEAGLFESMKKEDGGESAKSLLKKYGIAYLATSIPLALVSFTICYGLVDSGVDVAALLAKVGIDSAASEKAGTFAIAYAAHKAASPIRFPPTVVLTPIVAKMIGKEPDTTEDDVESPADP